MAYRWRNWVPCLSASLATSSCLSSSLQKMMTLKSVARHPSTPVPIEDFREFPPLSQQNDFPVNISAMAECVHLPTQISAGTWPRVSGCMWLQTDFGNAAVSCSFHGQALAVGQVSLAGDLAIKVPGSKFCDINRLSGKSEKFHSSGYLDEDVVVYVVPPTASWSGSRRSASPVVVW